MNKRYRNTKTGELLSRPEMLAKLSDRIATCRHDYAIFSSFVWLSPDEALEESIKLGHIIEETYHE